MAGCLTMKIYKDEAMRTPGNRAAFSVELARPGRADIAGGFIWWRVLAVMCIGAGFMQAAAAAAPGRLTAEQARHLLIRTGFAPTQFEVDAITGRDGAQVVAMFIDQARSVQPLHPPPAFVAAAPPAPPRLLKTSEERQAQRQQQQREGLEMKTWWLREMIESPAPLKERMTLFWHNHFATSQQKVVRSQGMWNQQAILRTDALGSFRTLLHGIAKDPAMLVYLDGARSRKEAPNENFAREVMELFTLGESSQGGRYSEQDIKEAARAFTGWSVDTEDFSFRLRPALHDNGSKTVLGHTGNFGGDAVIDILLEQPAAARFVVSKLWKEFISPVPDTVELERIAARFRDSGYDVSVVLGELFTSDAFWMPANRGALVKSPVDLVVGTVRQFGFGYTDMTPLALKASQLGQNLLVPPNVKGWPGQNEWINTTTLLERKRFTEQLFRVSEQKSDSKMVTRAMASGLPAREMAAAETARPRQQMLAEFGGRPGGQGSAKQAIRLMNREDAVRMADSSGRIMFDAAKWLAQYGGHVDREPGDEVKAQLLRAVLAVPPTQDIAAGTVGVAWLRNLTLDPAYQLK
jgi:uncharacterized protein (DUF1800 family)